MTNTVAAVSQSVKAPELPSGRAARLLFALSFLPSSVPCARHLFKDIFKQQQDDRKKPVWGISPGSLLGPQVWRLLVFPAWITHSLPSLPLSHWVFQREVHIKTHHHDHCSCSCTRVSADLLGCSCWGKSLPTTGLQVTKCIGSHDRIRGPLHLLDKSAWRKLSSGGGEGGGEKRPYVA